MERRLDPPPQGCVRLWRCPASAQVPAHRRHCRHSAVRVCENSAVSSPLLGEIPPGPYGSVEPRSTSAAP